MMLRSALVATLAVASAPLSASTYTLEPNYTQATVRWDHLGFSTPAAQIGQGEGTLEFDPADPGKDAVRVTLPLATLNTSVPDLDEHLRSKDFFETATFPTATFRSTKVAQGAAADRLEVSGDLTVHGVTKPVTLAVRVVKIGVNPRTGVPTLGFDATATLKRSDFGLGKFVPQVGDAIAVHITAQAVEANAYADYQKAQQAREKAAAENAAASKH